MDPVSLTAMDKKIASRLPQASAKSHSQSQDTNKDACKKASNGGASRRQQRDPDASGGGGGVVRFKDKGGRKKFSRNREKGGGELVNCDVVPRYGDDDYHDVLDGTEQHASSGYNVGHRGFGKHHRSDITSEMQSWWSQNDGNRRGGRQANPQQRKVSYKAQHRGTKGRAPGPSNTRKTKERVVQARCDFLVNFEADNQHQAVAARPVGCAPGTGLESTCPRAPDSDPDALVSWGAVEQVTLHTTQDTHCPVCLYSPVAAQVTRCGHVYCYPCILHYLALSDHKWRACPICYEMVVKEDLKSAVCVVHPDYVVGSQVRLTLMRRPRDSPLVLPVGGEGHTRIRRNRATAQQVLDIIQRERCSLEVQMSTEGEEPEACFIEQSLVLLEDREKGVSAAYSRQDALYAATLVNNQSEVPGDDTTNQYTAGAVGSCSTTSRPKRSSGSVSPIDRNFSAERQNDGVSVDLQNAATMQDSSSSNIEEIGVIGKKASKKSYRNNKKKTREDTKSTCSNKSGNSKTSEITDKSSPQYTTYDSVFDLPSPASSYRNAGNMFAEFSDEEDKSESSSSLSDAAITSSVGSDDVMFSMLDSLTMNDTHSTVSHEAHSAFDNDVPNTYDDDNSPCVQSSAELLNFQFDQDDDTDGSNNMRKSVSSPAGLVSKSDRSSNDSNSSGGDSSGWYHFYQASDGSHVYLHPLNMAMITEQYGSVSQCPRHIEAAVVEKDYCVMDECSRSRAKPIGHLPLCCPYEIVEVNLQPPLVTQHTLHNFQASLSRRQQLRQVRVRQEQQIERRNLAHHHQEMCGRLYTRVDSATKTRPGAVDTTVVAGGVYDDEWPSTSPPAVSGGGQPSFAKMLLVAQQPSAPVAPVAPSWPTLGSRDTSSGAGASWPHTSKTWGSGPPRPNTAAPPASDGDGQAPNYNKAFSLDIEALIQRAPPQVGGKKNKKGKRKFVRMPL